MSSTQSDDWRWKLDNMLQESKQHEITQIKTETTALVGISE